MVNFAPQEGYVIVVCGPMFSGKCLSAGTEVLMYDGSSKRAEDVREGDLLMGDDSTPRRVLVTSQGEGDLYDVVPATGTSYRVNGDHVLSLRCCHSLASLHSDKYRVRARWLDGVRIRTTSFAISAFGSVESARQAARQFLNGVTRTPKGEVLDIPLREFLALPKSVQGLYKGYTVPVEFADAPVPFDPYLVGLWLGDGSSDGPSFTNVDTEVLAYLAEAASEMGILLKQTTGTNVHRLTSGTQRGPHGRNPFLNFLRDFGLLGAKHVPYLYYANSREKRLALLAGLVDSDGYYGADRHDIDFNLISQRLAEDVAKLARSLGFRATVTPCQKTCTNAAGGPKTGDYYRFRVTGTGLHELPTRIHRKRVREHVYRNDRLVGIEIKPAGRGGYHGFTLDGNGRFLLADGTVTHNSTELIRLLVRAEVAGKRVGIFKPAVDDRDAEDAVVSRHGFSHPAHPIREASEILPHIDDYDLIAIDEAQFFGPDIVPVVERLADAGKQVVVAGLDLDYRRQPFGSMAELMVRAEFVEKLQAVCHRCGGPAFFTQRLIDGQPAPFAGETVVIGDLEAYEARCRHCYQPGLDAEDTGTVAQP